MEDKTINILLVEDDEVDIMNVRRAFRKGNIVNPLYVATNGLEALEILRGSSEHLPLLPSQRRLILLDLNMPKMGGIEFLQVIRADKDLRVIPVVVLTTSNGDRDRMEAYNLSVAGYLLKPVVFATFVEVMATLNHYWTFCEMP
jgi:CheY-like chemotaxis protein